MFIFKKEEYIDKVILHYFLSVTNVFYPNQRRVNKSNQVERSSILNLFNDFNEFEVLFNFNLFMCRIEFEWVFFIIIKFKS